ncbi:dTDP-4-dehydrorhamnose reductase [Shewanella litoralis]|uniref:dTDP-4-dehydrorhamnose reductase n=1 Tax=Shewanella litoralis TaxID=2282700 RepID=A0ABQ2RCH7_9GAMM|nr:dTDP-4-dehydrorhamnose reductase [Shewanella litoralis]GGQ22176.1 NAD(P)-dependent oxidoreductase [Shewanella litoralis]
MRILTFGQTGQLAKALKRTQPGYFELIQLTHQQVNITQPQLIDEALAHYRPNIIINCAAYTDVERAESNATQVMQTNVDAVRFMAKAARQYGIRFIQLSTDYVFDGLSSLPYTVDQKPCAINVYGQSKLLAENIILQQQSNQFCIVRTSWLYHNSGKNFVTTMLKLMSQDHNNAMLMQGLIPNINVVNDQTGSPTMVDGLAHFLWKLCLQKQWSAIYHWSDAGMCTWYEFAQEIQSQAVALGLIPTKVTLTPVTSEQYNSPVKRPTFSVLDTSHSHLILKPKPWQQQLAQCLYVRAINKD